MTVFAFRPRPFIWGGYIMKIDYIFFLFQLSFQLVEIFSFKIFLKDSHHSSRLTHYYHGEYMSGCGQVFFTTNNFLSLQTAEMEVLN